LDVQRVEVDAVGLVSDQQVVAAKIRAIADEVDAEPVTLARYRNVAHGWPEGTG
jgi:hypothetical protein